MSTAENSPPSRPAPPSRPPARRPTLDPASATIRNRVREALSQVATPAGAQSQPRVIVAVSGGADSMALLHACAFLHRRGEISARAVTVDHALQEQSAEVARRVVAIAASWEVPAEVVTVSVDAGEEGLEAAAREARYAALETARARHEADWVLTAHTRNDQAETVLLGLMRGSGTRSLAGMALRTGRVVRPLLTLSRATNESSCRAQDIEVWHDPMNTDDTFARVRTRTLLATLEGDLGQPVTANLARTAELCRADADYLEACAEPASAAIRGCTDVPLDELIGLADAILSRVVRDWLVSLGVPAQSIGSARIAELCALIRSRGEAARKHSPGAKGLPPERLSMPGDTEIIVTEVLLRFHQDAKAG